MSQYFHDYLKKHRFEKQLKRLKNKLKDKSVVIYGTGVLFQYIHENFDLTGLNIIGVSDMKFSEESEGGDFMGYKIIPKKSILNYKPDYVVVAVENYLGLMENLELKLFRDTKVRLLPLVRKNFSEIVKTIWEAL